MTDCEIYPSVAPRRLLVCMPFQRVFHKECLTWFKLQFNTKNDLHGRKQGTVCQIVIEVFVSGASHRKYPYSSLLKFKKKKMKRKSEKKKKCDRFQTWLVWKLALIRIAHSSRNSIRGETASSVIAKNTEATQQQQQQKQRSETV